MQLVCELLVLGTPPSAIPECIGTMFQTLCEEEPDEIPSVNFVRRCRAVIVVIAKTVVAMKLADSDTWDQIIADATSRRQKTFEALAIGLLDGNKEMEIVNVSSCIFLDDEKSDTVAEAIVNKVSYHDLTLDSVFLTHALIYLQIESLKSRLVRLRDVATEVCPDKVDLIPSPDKIDTSKFKGMVNMDNCNGANKTAEILLKKWPGSLRGHCMNHARNTWSGGIEKVLAKYLRVLLQDSLDEIDPRF